MYKNKEKEDKFEQKYEYLQQIGRGAFGDVFKIKNIKTEEILATKRIFISTKNDDQYNLLKNEQTILAEVKHEYIIKYHESFKDKCYIYIIMEYCEGEDLDKYIKYLKASNMNIDEKTLFVWINQLISAIKYLHEEKGIIHRDLKPSNILIKNKTNNTLKITDFGVARVPNGTIHTSWNVGTEPYKSPQILNEERYTNKCDIWALGVIIYELIEKELPFKNKKETENKEISNLQEKYQNLNSFIKILTNKEENKRYNISQTEKHFQLINKFNNENTTKIYLKKDMNLNDILITGSCNSERRKQLVENVFETQYQDTIEYSNDKFKFTQLCDLNRHHFDPYHFIQKCNDLRKNKKLKAIIMLSNLNPRPETLIDDTRTLLKAFDSEYLNQYLYVIFTFSNKSIELNSLRNDVIKFDQFFNDICCRDREKFIRERIWTLDGDYETIDRLKKLPFLKIQLPPVIYERSYSHSNTKPMEIDDTNSKQCRKNEVFDVKLTIIEKRKYLLIKIKDNSSNCLHDFLKYFPNVAELTETMSINRFFENDIYKNKLLDSPPISSFILVLKNMDDFERKFLEASKKLIELFGHLVLDHLKIVYLCLNDQKNHGRTYNLNNTEAYEYLIKENDNNNLPIYTINSLYDLEAVINEENTPNITRNILKSFIERIKEKNEIEVLRSDKRKYEDAINTIIDAKDAYDNSIENIKKLKKK